MQTHENDHPTIDTLRLLGHALAELEAGRVPRGKELWDAVHTRAFAELAPVHARHAAEALEIRAQLERSLPRWSRWEHGQKLVKASMREETKRRQAYMVLAGIDIARREKLTEEILAAAGDPQPIARGVQGVRVCLDVMIYGSVPWREESNPRSTPARPLLPRRWQTLRGVTKRGERVIFDAVRGSSERLVGDRVRVSGRLDSTPGPREHRIRSAAVDDPKTNARHMREWASLQGFPCPRWARYLRLD